MTRVKRPLGLKIWSYQSGAEPDATGVDAAYQKLERLAAEERRRSPHLSAEQCFSRVFSDPANAALAAKAQLFVRRQRRSQIADGDRPPRSPYRG
jgi:hypothetical protein